MFGTDKLITSTDQNSTRKIQNTFQFHEFSTTMITAKYVSPEFTWIGNVTEFIYESENNIYFFFIWILKLFFKTNLLN